MAADGLQFEAIQFTIDTCFPIICGCPEKHMAKNKKIIHKRKFQMSQRLAKLALEG